eukprot:5536547-Pyramimonas_sp.AAC.1
MKSKAGLGIDQLSPLDGERLPDVAPEGSCQLRNRIEEGPSRPGRFRPRRVACRGWRAEATGP